jgi:hypothetical protein
MRTLFSKSGLRIGVSLSDPNSVSLSIESDYSNSPRKSRLYINPDRLADKVEDFYRVLKTKTTKLTYVRLFFTEIDWYDNMTDMYETPVVLMSKGHKKPRVGYNSHGSIPKDWGVVLIVKFNPIKQKKPITEAIKLAVGSLLNTTDIENIEKTLGKFLSGKLMEKQYLNMSFYEDE